LGKGKKSGGWGRDRSKQTQAGVHMSSHRTARILRKNAHKRQPPTADHHLPTTSGLTASPSRHHTGPPTALRAPNRLTSESTNLPNLSPVTRARRTRNTGPAGLTAWTFVPGAEDYAGVLMLLSICGGVGCLWPSDNMAPHFSTAIGRWPRIPTADMSSAALKSRGRKRSRDELVGEGESVSDEPGPSRTKTGARGASRGGGGGGGGGGGVDKAAPPPPSLPGGVVHALPEDLRDALLASTRGERELWQTVVTPLGRNEFICWLQTCKREETRRKRVTWALSSLAEGKRRPCCWPGCPHRGRGGTKAAGTKG
jgi:hypothetical protein